MLAVSGCLGNEKRLEASATKIGTLAGTGKTKQRLPDECYIAVPHTNLDPAEDVVILLDKEMVQKDRESESKLRCSKTSDAIADALQ